MWPIRPCVSAAGYVNFAALILPSRSRILPQRTKKTRPLKTVFWQGNEACVEGAMAAGCRFFAGYPITPSSEIAEGHVPSGSRPWTGHSFRWRMRSPAWAR